MRKLLIFLICLIMLALSSCDSGETNSHPDIEVSLPDGSITDSSESLPESIDKNNVSIGKPEIIVDYYSLSSTALRIFQLFASSSFSAVSVSHSLISQTMRITLSRSF